MAQLLLLSQGLRAQLSAPVYCVQSAPDIQQEAHTTVHVLPEQQQQPRDSRCTASTQPVYPVLIASWQSLPADDRGRDQDLLYAGTGLQQHTQQHGQGPALPGTVEPPETVHSPWHHLPPIKGTLRGQYKGNASDQWLAKEVQREVDDIARAVDMFAIDREGRLCAAQHNALKAQQQELQTEKNALATRVAQLQLLVPEGNGTFRKLRDELVFLEKECDAHFERLQKQEAARQASDFNAQTLQGQVNWLQGQLGPGQGLRLHRRSGTGGGQLQQEAAEVPFVTPEAVLAAVAFLREKGELPPSLMSGHPNTKGILLRLLLVLLVACCIAAAVVSTYFLTKGQSA